MAYEAIACEHFYRRPIDGTDRAEPHCQRIEACARFAAGEPCHSSLRPLRLVRDDLEGAADDLML